MGTRNGKSELVEGICNGLIEYDFEGVRTRFLPEDVIHNLINEASVRNELNSKARCLVQSLTSRGPDELTKFITNSKDPAKKVFAAAILANIKDQELRNSMRGFRDKKFTDKDLPLREGSDILEKRSYDLFQEKQFQVSAHIFTEPECEKDFRVKLNTFSIFPFEEVESKIGAGAFSKVYKVRIHKSHQTFHEKQEWFAIKSITADSLDCKATESAFNQEAQALYETSQLKHPNIVRAFAAISRGKGRYFLFEWANKGSLDDFYKSKEPELSRGYIRNIVSQLLGLANAIRRLHHFGGGESYRHGDLKPANILCFGDDNDSIGRWKISDLGLAKHHMEVTALRGPTQTRHSTIRYEAPETTTLQQGGRSRQYDMWSLGCITLELIVWLLYGHKGRDAFNQDIGDNSYYEVHDTGAVVHPSVKFWMDHIQENDPECSCESSALRDLLGMVNKKLIVVAVNPGSNTSEEYSVNTSEHPVTVTVMQPDSGGPVQQQSYRSTAKDFDNALRNMTNQHQDHDDPYWFTGARRDQVQRPVIPKQRQRHGTYLKVADAMKPPPRQREPGLQPSHTVRTCRCRL